MLRTALTAASPEVFHSLINGWAYSVRSTLRFDTSIRWNAWITAKGNLRCDLPTLGLFTAIIGKGWDTEGLFDRFVDILELAGENYWATYREQVQGSWRTDES